MEDLQLKKQLLLKQGVQPTLNPSSLSAFSATNVSSSDGHSMNSAQRAALQTANAQSMGYFITQVTDAPGSLMLSLIGMKRLKVLQEVAAAIALDLRFEIVYALRAIMSCQRG